MTSQFTSKVLKIIWINTRCIGFEVMINFLRFICMVMKGTPMNNFSNACLNEKNKIIKCLNVHERLIEHT